MKLSDVCFEMHQGINTVADKVKYYECGTPILQSKNITNGILDLEDVRFVNENDYNKYKEKYIPHKGNILLSNIGTIGKSLLIEEEKNFLIAWNIFLIKVNESKINSKFLNFYFQYLDMSNYYNKYLTGGTVKFINKKTMENIEIPNISLVNQIEIANKLEKVQKMIDIRKKQIEELDKLIKSQFVEMFGEPLTSNNYGRVTLDKLTKVNQGLQIPISKRFNEDGKDRYKYITIQYLNGSKQTEYIENPNDRVICKKDDILMTRTGNTGQVITNVEGVFHNNFFKVDYDREKLNKEFLIKYFEDDGIYRDMIRRATTSTIPDLSHSEFYKMSIDLPPIELQNEFAELVKQINQQKFEIQKNLEEMQKLQESFMNKYFG